MTTRLFRFWSNALAIAYKETRVLRHDAAVLSTVFVQPLMMLGLFGFGLSNRPTDTPWVVLDRSQTALSRRLIAEITHSGYFLAPQAVDGYGEARMRLRTQRAIVAVVIPRDFRRDAERGRPTVQVLLNGSEPLTAARLGAYVAQVAAHFAPRRTAPDAARRGPPAEPLAVQQQFWFNPTLRDRNFFMAGLAGLLLTNLCLSVTTLGIVGERENGTYEQMLALPTSPLEIVIGKLLPYVVVSYGVFALGILLPGLCFDLWPRGNPLAIVLVTLPFILASLAIGVFVSTLAHNSAQAVFITIFFIMPSFVLSGAMLPYGLMPHGVREVGGLMPMRWYQIAMRRLVERGGGFADIAVPGTMLVVIFAGLLLAISRRMRPRLA